ncbi:MAG: hypothetical protein H0X38_05155 [Planctomycetes bacterium]|nr:hypothetical protein [Planctomycetota bacterium]
MRSRDVAAALVGELRDLGFPSSVVLQRAYLPLTELGEVEALHVTVLINGRTTTMAGRGRMQIDHRLELAVQQRLGSDDPSAVDSLLDLVEDLTRTLSARRLAEAPDAVWVQAEHAPLVATEHLHELRQFTSLLTLTYRSWETV